MISYLNYETYTTRFLNSPNQNKFQVVNRHSIKISRNVIMNNKIYQRKMSEEIRKLKTTRIKLKFDLKSTPNEVKV